jgi:hypothetical protein
MQDESLFVELEEEMSLLFGVFPDEETLQIVYLFDFDQLDPTLFDVLQLSVGYLTLCSHVIETVLVLCSLEDG